MADVKISQLAAASPASRAAGAALWTHKGHIEGLKLEWVSGTSLRVTSGSAYIQSLGYAIDVPAAITKAGIALVAATWYHVYLFDNAGAPDIEIVTTAPAVAYSGTARSKTGDTSRRYLGSMRTKAAATEIIQFGWSGGGSTVIQRYNSAAEPMSVISGGVATIWTNVSCATLVPVTGRIGFLRLNNTASATLLVANPESEDFASGTNNIIAMAPGVQSYVDFWLDASQQMNYRYTSEPASGDLKVNVMGYQLER